MLLQKPRMYNPIMPLVSLPRIAEAIVTLPLATATPQLYWKLGNHSNDGPALINLLDPDVIVLGGGLSCSS